MINVDISSDGRRKRSSAPDEWNRIGRKLTQLRGALQDLKQEATGYHPGIQRGISIACAQIEETLRFAEKLEGS